MKRILRFVNLLIVAALVSKCNPANYPAKISYSFKSADGKPDYSKPEYWAAHPHKWDPSDSIPSDLRDRYKKDSIADVFFLYPTSFTSGSDTGWNAGIDDSSINRKTDYSSILYQASAFSEKTRVFAPRYRQAHYRSFLAADRNKADIAFGIAYEDIKKAFLYYLSHENRGRPFIIAAHSQGTYHAARLIREMIEGKALQQQLIIAYLIGMPIAEDYFSSIKPCADSVSTGCIVSWRTYKRGYTDPLFAAKENFRTVITNPLIWNSSKTFASITLNRGAVLRKFNSVKPKVVNAQINGNVLWTSKPRFFGNIFLRQKNYHIADINFFYVDIADNVRLRINSYLERNQ